MLVLVPGALGERVSGPEIRAWAIAQALAERGDVTAAIPGARRGTREGVRIVPATRTALLREAWRHDALISACVPPYLLALKRWRPLLVISDQYDPVELELATLRPGRQVARRLAATRAVRRLQLRFADVVLCAGERQRTALAEEISQGGRPGERRPRLEVVPFGLPEAPRPSDTRPLRARFAQIRADDRIVLWWGSIWRWLDAETAIRAAALIAPTRPEVKLVFTSGRPPRQAVEKFAATERARQLARELGLLDRHVFFLDEWIPYAERHECLGEADVGLTLHHDLPEARLAARARYMDYLWAGLPCVLATGDEAAGQLAAGGFAALVPPGDPDAAARAVLDLLDRPGALRAAAAAGEPLAAARRWTVAVGPLRDALADARPGRVASRAAPGLLAGATAYYSRRAADRVLASQR